MNLNKEITFGSKKTTVDKIPTKNYINLIIKKKSNIRPVTVIPSVIIICLLAALFSKYAVVDLLTDLDKAQARVSTAQAALDADYAAIDSYGNLEERYPHYTFSGMTQTELTTVSRADILALLQQRVIPYAVVDSWSVSYNTVTLKITAETLQDINVIAQYVNADDRVDYCTVNSAKNEVRTVTYTDAYGNRTAYVEDVDDSVTGQLTITMKDVLKGAFEG